MVLASLEHVLSVKKGFAAFAGTKQAQRQGVSDSIACLGRSLFLFDALPYIVIRVLVSRCTGSMIDTHDLHAERYAIQLFQPSS